MAERILDCCVGFWKRNERGGAKIKFDFWAFALYFFLEHNYINNGTITGVF
jgi:hypothetical protein